MKHIHTKVISCHRRRLLLGYFGFIDEDKYKKSYDYDEVDIYKSQELMASYFIKFILKTRFILAHRETGC